jgi:hypothetical protein
MDALTPLTPRQQAAAPLHHHAYRRWEAAVAALLAAALFIPLDEKLTPGPGWAPVAVVGALLVVIVVMQEAIRRPGGWTPSVKHVRMLALLVLGILALAEASALVLLILRLPSMNAGGDLFVSAGLLWTINLLVFALCYWELDGGGPARRPPAGCPPTDFLFPQQTDPRLTVGWTPEFVDYLFLAFNTGTAFSPTDTMVLSRKAKLFMMAQATIALLTIGLVVARGVNII